MANVVITDTDKVGFIKFVYNDYYPTVTDHKVQFQRKENISAIDIIDCGGTEVLEIMDDNTIRHYFIHSASDHFFTVDSVNGVAPTSLTDLRDKILALL
jgi:hypothetical protein